MKLSFNYFLAAVLVLMPAFLIFEPAAFAEGGYRRHYQDYDENAWQQEAQHHIDLFDTDHDGAVTRGEWQGSTEKFERLDAIQRDGVLTREEFFSREEWEQTAAQSQPAVQRGWTRQTRASAFGQYDLNGDGFITQNEWRGNPWSFRKYDSNGDGALSREEVSRWGSSSNYRRNNWQYDNSYGMNSSWVQEARHHWELFNTNRDGVVTRDEWQGSSEKFQRLDSIRSDGVLTRDEFFRPQEWPPAAVAAPAAQAGAPSEEQASSLEQMLLQLFSQ